MRNNYYRYFQKQWMLCLLFGIIPMLISAQDLTLQTAEVLNANLEESDLSKNLYSETMLNKLLKLERRYKILKILRNLYKE